MKSIVFNGNQGNQETKRTFVSSVNSFSKVLMMSAVILLLLPLWASSQHCSFTVTSLNNIESVNADGRIYFIQLKNNSNEGVIVGLSVVNNNLGKNPDSTSCSTNVQLTAQLINSAGQRLPDHISLDPNAQFSFQVKVIAPVGTLLEHWNKLLLKAVADKCPGYMATVDLYTFIPRPE
jgi:hypothetical protein